MFHRDPNGDATRELHFIHSVVVCAMAWIYIYFRGIDAIFRNSAVSLGGEMCGGGTTGESTDL